MPLKLTDMINRSSTKTYFNPLVTFSGCDLGYQYKYGIIHYKDFLSDLVDWTEFYTSARLQKPVLPIIMNDDENIISDALEINKRNALALGLLLMPTPDFTLMDMFLSVTKLSYMGDIRMKIKAENPNKIMNIVEPNFEKFLEYYQKWIDEFEKEGAIVYKGNSVFGLNYESEEGVAPLIEKLPNKSYIKLWVNNGTKGLGLADLQFQLKNNIEIINSVSSRKSIVKALYTTNPVKNILYAL
eukprot:CAMPEP_0205800830 /NCGR_PEP_ID=MMETSP0205-20121125/2618_1 /ASSEMBLY_ACC=CAM_ASM_000278 /TAXON_ID=36767 /ORGANISM="Euplotes focardii, Strain TN1" /LENGTH=241 /DNA_ID=CAMNT_0053064569 /DNA_START=135 /DNA_END=857 /DNA_ORIENTATION=+